MSLTPEQFRDKIKARIRELNTGKLIYPVATAIHGMMLQRIFDKGINGAGTSIGRYSVNPAYYTRKQFKRGGSFKGQGKKAKGKFKNGKQRKSMYLSGGYKQLKSIQGMQSAFVNLSYSNDLRNDFATKLAISGDSVVLRLSRKINISKVVWMREKYGKSLWKHTESERDFFETEVTAKLLKFIEN